jgi:hypothetical protein
MVSVLSLIVPILVAAVLVFIASSVIHMVLGYHRNDLGKLAREDDVMAALRAFAIPPGDYVMPCPSGPQAMKDPAFVDKVKKGPAAFMTVMPGGGFSMAKNLTLWFIYSLLVGVFAAYITGRALGPGVEYLDVFRFAGTTAFLGYSFALLQNSIWYYRNWRMTLLSVFDGLVYALLTAGAFGWLWPQ